MLRAAQYINQDKICCQKCRKLKYKFSSFPISSNIKEPPLMASMALLLWGWSPPRANRASELWVVASVLVSVLG